ncbi:MAG: hypothetical protein ACI8W3_001288 [Myxococcota bacterium]|jgi:hypothetical protein
MRDSRFPSSRSDTPIPGHLQEMGLIIPILDELHREVWGARHVSEFTVHQAIRACSGAVGDDGRSQHVIETAARSGYQFVGEVRFLSSAQVLTKASSIGRESTLAELKTAVGSAMDGRGRIILISGEPGIGKTHTLAQVEQIACESGGDR